jgi:PAS domain S-box-containing protein
MSFCEDITERKKAEQALDESEEKYRKLFEESMDAVFLADTETGIIVDCNSAASRLVGRQKSELVGQHQSIFTPQKEMEGEFAKVFKQHLKDQTKSLETQITRKTGEIRDVVINDTIVELKGKKLMQGTLNDITERKKVEETLRKSEEEYFALFTNMIDGFAYCKMIFDENDKPVDFVYLQINDAFERITGLKREMVLGKKVTQAIPNIIESNPELFEIYGRVALTGQKEKFEVFFKPLSLWLSISVYCPAKGYFAAIFEDITEPKKAKRELQESEKRYRSLFEQAPLPVTITAVDGTLLDANIAMQIFTGYSLEELKKNPAAYSYENPQDKKTLHKTLKRDSVVSDFPTRLKCRDGNLVDVVLNVSKFKIGKDIVLRTTIQDVTEQKKAEKALQESQQKFKALFSANPDPAAFLDIDFNVIEANSQFSTLFGYTFDEIKSKNVMDLIVPDDSKEEASNIRQTVISDSIEIFTTRRKKDGTQIPLFMSGGPVSVNEKVIGSIMVYKDISDIITVQEELSNALDKAELLNEKLNVVGGLTRHDVRNKLSTVTGYAYILKKKHRDQEDIMDGLGKMEQAVAESMKIFDFAKMYEQLGLEDLTYINVEAKIKEASTLFSGSIPNIINECTGLVVLADSFLSQLFYNFIDNTRKYGKKATTIRIHCEKAEPENLKLIYEDDGVGVPHENKPRIFKEGFSTGGSTGFGLFFTKRMMDVYGWQIQEDGTPGKGAKFTITIPKISQNGKENFQIGP